ncbi:YgjP-like metallopeptidase domain-containing protein, partial [Aeromonas veronii]|uniref:YgjP-like metallopeptidase domain-containing protein n=1 Tax=Aeromonas veronii TaxID=654 RepID=UPI0038B51BBC
HAIVHRGTRSGATRVEAGPEGAVISVSCEAEHVARRVRDLLQREARTDLAQAVAAYSQKLGQAPRRMTLRDTRSRWGSCTAAGELNFSWRL